MTSIFYVCTYAHTVIFELWLLQKNSIIFLIPQQEIKWKANPDQATLNEPNTNTMILSPTTEDEIKSTMNKMKSNKATCPNRVPTKIPKNNKNKPAKLLCNLINLVLHSGTYPDILKVNKSLYIADRTY